MAREKLVTRTFKSAYAEILFLNVETGESTVREILMGTTYKDDAKLLKAVQKIYDTETEKAVHVKSVKEVTSLRGMTADEFVQHSREIPVKG